MPKSRSKTPFRFVNRSPSGNIEVRLFPIRFGLADADDGVVEKPRLEKLFDTALF